MELLVDMYVRLVGFNFKISIYVFVVENVKKCKIITNRYPKI